MKLHYMGKFDLDPESLPHGEHMPNATRFREANTSKELSLIANTGSVILMILLLIPAALRTYPILDRSMYFPLWLGCIAPMLTMLPHELLHAICFRGDVYLYTNLKQGMLFVVGPETMSKARFIFLSLLPNIVFGMIPFALGLIFPRLVFLTAFGILCIGMGFGDYYNVFNALTQMPQGARTYMYGFNSYWYLP